ncbi:putative ABC transporter permease [Pasteurella multocida]|nr:putative ABC transporter permease [Pasteurella multocida]
MNGASSLTSQDFLDEKELPNVKDIFWRNNIVGFAPLLSANVQAQKANQNTLQPIQILGTFFDRQIAIPDEADYHTGQKIISPYWKVQGEWVNDLQDQFSTIVPALAGEQLAKTWSLQPGEQIHLAYQDEEFQQQLTVEIKGILATGGSEEQQLVLPLSAVQQLLGLEGKIQAIKVSALTVPENELSRKARANVEGLDAEEYDRWYCTAYVSSIAHQLEEAISGAIVRPIWQVAASEGVVIEKIQLLLAVVTVAAVIAAAMGIASLMTSTIIERSKEIGLMKALGAYQWQIVLLFYCEATISALFGGILGCLAGWGTSKIYWYHTFWSPFRFYLDSGALCISALYLDCLNWYLVPGTSDCQSLPC